jgi:NAD-dependent deacetylase
MATPVDADTGIPFLADLIRLSERVLIFTGAGISTASGIPDYRGPQGIWKSATPIYYQTFMTDHEARVESWERGLQGSALLGAAEPNPVHYAVAELERSGKVELVVTQNIDGLHRDAGTSQEKLVEIHGTTREIECQSCGERSHPASHLESFAETGEPPLCHCGGFLKSATISFGQQLREVDIALAFDAAERSDLAMSLGSTLSVTPAADVPIRAAVTGARYAIVNRGVTEHDHLPLVTLRIEGDVVEAFPPAVEIALG